MTPHWQRHDLAHVRPGVRLPETPAGRWLAAGGVGVVCRHDDTAAITPGPRVRLGVCLPGSRSERDEPGQPPRGACEVHPGTLAAVCPPFRISEVLRSAPPTWRAGLADLVARGERIGVRWRVFGSMAWQHLHGGGSSFVNPATSDADLLFTPASGTQLDAALAVLQRHPGFPRLDGEAVFPGGLGVSWRELAGGAARVLVKRLDRVELRQTAALRALLPP